MNENCERCAARWQRGNARLKTDQEGVGHYRFVVPDTFARLDLNAPRSPVYISAVSVKASLRTQRARYGTACLQSDSLWNNFILYPLGL